jgi:CHAD domain-containing protein
MTEAAEYQPQPGSQSAFPPPILAYLQEVAAGMRERLDACRQKGDDPEVEEVHRLRTGTRRVEATLETLAREAGARGLGKAAEEARQRWLRQLKKVRRAAGVVRDLDVHRDLLAENFVPTGSSESKTVARELAVATGPNEFAALAAQAQALDGWLKNRRTAAAADLCTTLDKHVSRLLEVEQQFMAAMEQRRSSSSRTHRPAARLALEDYLRVVDGMPLLDKENLHDFRKGAKKARYVADSEENDPPAKAIAKTIKAVQDAIGEWHDWEVLASEAREALDQGGAALHADLETRAQRAYDRALRMTMATNRRLVGEWRASRPRRDARRLVPRKAQ